MSNKKVFWDMSPHNKRSIREIPLVDNLSAINVISEDVKSPHSFSSDYFHKKKIIIIISSIVITLFCVTSIFSFFFAGATIVVVPKQEKIDLNSNFNAVIGTSTDGIQYKVITLTDSGSKKVVADGEEYVEKRASGVVTIYNNFNSSDQRLIKNTRFETPEGLIYRIDKTVVVPGMTIKDGKDSYGSVDVTVYADHTGEKYNITDPTTFSIPGFKGTTRFDKFYAKSKNPIGGGFVGTIKKVSDEVWENSKNDIRNTLKEELIKKVYLEKSLGSIIFNDGILIKYESLPNKDLVSKDSVEILEKAILYAVAFDQKQLNDHIVKNNFTINKVADDTDNKKDINENIEIVNINDLDFKINNKDVFKPLEDGRFTFTLKGLAKFVWFFDEDELKKSLAGQSRDNISSMLFLLSNIKEAEIKIRPFWANSLPKDLEKIKIEKNIDS